MRFLTLIPIFFSLRASAALISRSFPHLIVPVSSYAPDVVLGTKPNFDIQHATFSLFSFDVPANGANYCNLAMSVNKNPSRGPGGAPLTIWGDDPLIFNISTVDRSINQYTDTWNNHPQPKDWVASVVMNRDGTVNKVIGGGVPCAKGQVAQFIAYPGSSGGFGIQWYELDYPEGSHGITYDMST